MPSEYEKERQANILRNAALLAELGMAKPFFEPKETIRKPKAVTKKRKPEVELPQESLVKVSRVDNRDVTAGTRRSQRNVDKTIDYTKAQNRGMPIPARVRSGITSSGDGPLGRESGKRIHDPKTFGSIPGIAVGTWWETREGCSIDAVHAPWVAGISGSKRGAYSVALSGGYDDDVDLGSGFTYTGSGGRDLKGTKTAPKNLRTAPQSSDQSFENDFNMALKKSSETKKPVRVIRGYKLKSAFAPSEGYRYDGLYRVEKAWMEKGLNPKGYMVCKFAFVRIAGQPAIPVQGENADD
jgi:E3 ubiquitin-protein ligase UHRF1